MNQIVCKPYSEAAKHDWDSFVRDAAKNATFLFERSYMDYHAQRFDDHSLMFMHENKTFPIALLPACVAKGSETEGIIASHDGLTYGGLLINGNVKATDVAQCLQMAAAEYLQRGFHTLRYKCVPHIYWRIPCQADTYWLFRAQAQLRARGLSSATDLAEDIHLSELRRRGLHKAQKHNLLVTEAGNDHALWAAFWEVLSEGLRQRHALNPVHTLDEMMLLHRNFPQQIRCWVVRTKGGEVVGGSVIYECKPVAHAQYINASELGLELGALDLLFHHLTNAYKARCHEGFRYFDFGISTENQGRWLNEGLTFQKEGFGARSVTYDQYDVALEKLAELRSHTETNKKADQK